MPEVAGETKKLKASDAKRLEKLTAKTAQARAEADTAIAQDVAAAVPENIRDKLEHKTADLDVIEDKIDLVDFGAQTELDTDGVVKAAQEALKYHSDALKKFTSVRKAIAKAGVVDIVRSV